MHGLTRSLIQGYHGLLYKIYANYIEDALIDDPVAMIDPMYDLVDKDAFVEDLPIGLDRAINNITKSGNPINENFSTEDPSNESLSIEYPIFQRDSTTKLVFQFEDPYDRKSFDRISSFPARFDNKIVFRFEDPYDPDAEMTPKIDIQKLVYLQHQQDPMTRPRDNYLVFFIELMVSR